MFCITKLHKQYATSPYYLLLLHENWNFHSSKEKLCRMIEKVRKHKILLNNATYQYFQILMIDVHFLAKSQCQLTLDARIYKEG